MFRSKATRLLTAAGLLLTGCAHEMMDQPRLDTLEEHPFFPHRQGARPLVQGVVPRGNAYRDHRLQEGMENGQPMTQPPFELTVEVLERGRERYNIYCAVCHDRTGSGLGMVVRRGYPAPPSFHSDRVRGLPIGHIVNVATNGFGRMPAYRNQVPARDRWAIAAYVIALQTSQHAPADVLDDQEQQQLNGAEPR